MSEWRILVGDVRERLRELPAGSVQTCVTSPPYWGLRDYGAAGQIGLESTPDAYVAQMVAVFREVKRVLRDDGTVWLNLGDSYAGGGNTGRNDADTIRAIDATSGRRPNAMAYGDNDRGGRVPRPVAEGLKPKDLCGIPWRVAFALQADGWYLRSDIIWAKKNCMPESVTDRPTRSHEYIFLLSKSERYYYDAAAIAETALRAGDFNNAAPQHHEYAISRVIQVGETRNKRSVWHVATRPYPEAHFATYPEKLIEPCILAGTSEKGCCPSCLAPWVRVTNIEREQTSPGHEIKADASRNDGGRAGRVVIVASTTIRWEPSCSCNAGAPVPCTVLDPFTGSGTTGAVAIGHGRNFVGVELNPEYVTLAKRRIGAVSPLFARETPIDGEALAQAAARRNPARREFAGTHKVGDKTLWTSM